MGPGDAAASLNRLMLSKRGRARAAAVRCMWLQLACSPACAAVLRRIVRLVFRQWKNKRDRCNFRVAAGGQLRADQADPMSLPSQPGSCPASLVAGTCRIVETGRHLSPSPFWCCTPELASLRVGGQAGRREGRRGVYLAGRPRFFAFFFMGGQVQRPQQPTGLPQGLFGLLHSLAY